METFSTLGSNVMVQLMLSVEVPWALRAPNPAYATRAVQSSQLVPASQ